jgi:hypothetical protein
VTQNAETPHKKTKKSIIIGVLSGISLAYIGIVYLLIIETAACDQVAISANWFKGFWDQYLGCRSVNELGDTLAGVFAPVAFLWLMGAVFIQSQELKAQREELDETQEVMRAQLVVAKQQVEETKASTALFRKQTEILEDEQHSRKCAEADKSFDFMLEKVKTYIVLANGLSVWLSQPDAGQHGRSVYIGVVRGEVHEMSFEKLFRETIHQLNEAHETLNNYGEDFFLEDWTKRSNFEIVRLHIQEAVDFISNLSSGYQVWAEALQIREVAVSLQSLITALDENHNRLQG